MSEGKDRLKQLRNALGMSQPVFSQYLEINNSTINNIEGGYQKLSVKVALALKEKIVQSSDGRLRIVMPDKPRKEDEAQLRMEWLLTGEGEPFEKIIEAQDGFKLTFQNEEIILPKGYNIQFCKISDDSMFPEFLKNDYIAIDTDEKEIKNGGVYLISVFEDEILRSVFRTGKNKLNIVAKNKDLAPSFEIDESEIKVIGKYIYKVTIALN